MCSGTRVLTCTSDAEAVLVAEFIGRGWHLAGDPCTPRPKQCFVAPSRALSACCRSAGSILLGWQPQLVLPPGIRRRRLGQFAIPRPMLPGTRLMCTLWVKRESSLLVHGRPLVTDPSCISSASCTGADVLTLSLLEMLSILLT